MPKTRWGYCSHCMTQTDHAYDENDHSWYCTVCGIKSSFMRVAIAIADVARKYLGE